MCDDKYQWWPEWYDYKMVNKSGPVYRVLMSFSSKWKLNLKKYIICSDSLHLTDPKYFIHSAFSYDAHDDIIQSKQYIASTHWEF